MTLTRQEIIEKMGITHVDSARQEELLNQLADTVKTRIVLKLTEKLTDDELDKLEALMDADDVAGFDAFVVAKVPDYDAWATQIEEETINELENNSKAIDDMVEAKSLESVSTD